MRLVRRMTFAAPFARAAIAAAGHSRPDLIVDMTHCGRHVTGLERIAEELFSREALAPLAVSTRRSGGRLGMVLGQTLGLPLAALRNPDALILCPGFPPMPTLTRFGARVIPYIHDDFLVSRRAELNPRARLYMAPAFRHALARLPRFLVNSRVTAARLAPLVRPDAEIRLYRPPVRDVFGLASGAAAGRREPGPLRLLALGTVEPRKNLMAAAAVVAALRERGASDARLDIVGRPGWGPDAAALAALPHVRLHGYLPAEALRRLIGQADVLLAASRDEGLGLPLLEVQHGGLDIVANDIPAFREVLGDSGLLLDIADARGAAAAILARLAAPGWREGAAAAARANLARWNEAAETDRREVIAMLTRLLAGLRG